MSKEEIVPNYDASEDPSKIKEFELKGLPSSGAQKRLSDEEMMSAINAAGVRLQAISKELYDRQVGEVFISLQFPRDGDFKVSQKRSKERPPAPGDGVWFTRDETFNLVQELLGVLRKSEE